MESEGVFSLALGFLFPNVSAARWIDPTWRCGHGFDCREVYAGRRNGSVFFCSHEKYGMVPEARDRLPIEVFTWAPYRQGRRKY